MKLLGIVLVILGIVGLAYGGVAWTTKEKVVDLGPLQVTHDKTQSLPLPPIAGGLGSLTHLDASIGKRYRSAGKERSYVSARCSDGILSTRGRFTFADGTVIDGSVEKACTVR